MKTVNVQSLPIDKIFTASEQESFKRMLETPLKSRAVRPHFGNLLHTLIDRNMDEAWKIDFRRYTLEAFYDENHQPWDERLIPSEVSMNSIDATKNEVYATLKFKEFQVDVNMGGF